ncbi:MAG: hypothetical protein EU529_05490 [Promethearchaeota archaeon]|nr:MAG: hypothetical protein EU529_05490 [Candidatus Lokiarchaeota archaeon]
MPRGDGTGPWGQGSMTGRGLGYCAGYNTPGYTKGPGMGLGRGWSSRSRFGIGRNLAWRRGWGRGVGGFGSYRTPIYLPSTMPQPIVPENQLNMLKQEKQFLQSEMERIKNGLGDISKRIEELEKTE